MRCRRTLNCKVNAKSLILDIICANFLQPIYNTCITYGIDYMNTVCGRIILCEVVFFFKKKIIIYLWWSREHTNWALGAKHGMLLFSRQTSLSFVWHGRHRHKWRTASCLYLKKTTKKQQDFMDGSDWTAELQIQLRYRLLNLTWTLLV